MHTPPLFYITLTLWCICLECYSYLGLYYFWSIISAYNSGHTHTALWQQLTLIRIQIIRSEPDWSGWSAWHSLLCSLELTVNMLMFSHVAPADAFHVSYVRVTVLTKEEFSFSQSTSPLIIHSSHQRWELVWSLRAWSSHTVEFMMVGMLSGNPPVLTVSPQGNTWQAVHSMIAMGDVGGKNKQWVVCGPSLWSFRRLFKFMFHSDWD